MELNTQGFIGLAGFITAGCTAIYHIYKIRKVFTADRQEFRQSILDEAKSIGDRSSRELENKIESVESDLENLKYSTQKDVQHLKETYTNEIKNLSERIENLREEIRAGHSSMVTLLTALVEKRN